MTKTLSAAIIHALGVVSTGDITATNLEPIIDQAIGIVNAEVGLEANYLSGTVGTKSVPVGDGEFAIISTLTCILALNKVLLNEDSTWTIERRGNVQEMIGSNGALTRRYEALVESFKQGIAETETSTGEPVARRG